MTTYKEYAAYDFTAQYREITDILISNGYYSGYSTFWRANVLTELSDGTIDVWCWCDDADDMALKNVTDINQTNKWLQIIEHDYTHPAGKVFVLLTEGEYENITWDLQPENIIYDSTPIIILGYEDYEDLLAETVK